MAINITQFAPPARVSSLVWDENMTASAGKKFIGDLVGNVTGKLNRTVEIINSGTDTLVNPIHVDGTGLGIPIRYYWTDLLQSQLSYYTIVFNNSYSLPASYSLPMSVTVVGNDSWSHMATLTITCYNTAGVSIYTKSVSASGAAGTKTSTDTAILPTDTYYFELTPTYSSGGNGSYNDGFVGPIMGNTPLMDNITP